MRSTYIEIKATGSSGEELGNVRIFLMLRKAAIVSALHPRTHVTQSHTGTV